MAKRKEIEAGSLFENVDLENSSSVGHKQGTYLSNTGKSKIAHQTKRGLANLDLHLESFDGYASFNAAA